MIPLIDTETQEIYLGMHDLSKMCNGTEIEIGAQKFDVSWINASRTEVGKSGYPIKAVVRTATLSIIHAMPMKKLKIAKCVDFVRAHRASRCITCTLLSEKRQGN